MYPAETIEYFQELNSGLPTETCSAEVKTLVEGCKENKRLAQEKLYKKYYGSMMVLAMRFLTNKDDALEVLNTGFLKVFQSIHNYKYSGSLYSWIYTIVRFTIIDFMRKKIAYKETHTINEIVENKVYACEGAVEKLKVQDLLKMLNDLPSNSRLVFNLYAIEGYSHKEIAKLLSISEGTSKWQLAQARQILKRSIEKELEHGKA